MNTAITILSTFGSLVSIAFGVWHFFVPAFWNWYSYIDPKATELVLAVRAINIMFSLSLTLFGIATLVFLYSKPLNKLSLIVMFSISIILWGTRFVLQVIYPQGSIDPRLQYGMLTVFFAVFLCFVISLVLVQRH